MHRAETRCQEGSALTGEEPSLVSPYALDWRPCPSIPASLVTLSPFSASDPCVPLSLNTLAMAFRAIWKNQESPSPPSLI